MLNFCMISLVSIFAFAQASFAAPVEHETLPIDDARVRMIHGNAPATAAYASITNKGDQADRLVSIATDIARKSEIHVMKVEDGVMSMRPLTDGIIIAPGETVTLKPGGVHFMLMKLTSRPGRGENVELRLTFEQAGTVTIMAPVVKIRHSH